MKYAQLLIASLVTMLNNLGAGQIEISTNGEGQQPFQ